MSNIIKHTGKAIGYLGGGLTLITFGQGIQQNKQNKAIIDSLNKRIEMQESIITKYETVIKKGNDYSKLQGKVSDVNEVTESAIKESSKITEISKNLENSNLETSQTEMLTRDLYYHSNILEKNLSTGNKQLEELNKMLQDIFGSDSNKNFNSNGLDDFKNYLSSLPIEKVGALGHILISIAILLSLLSIISVFYGDFLIKYFNLEEKFPRIAKFILLRRKFQQYYFTFNIIAIILALLLIIYVNFIVFLS